MPALPKMIYDGSLQQRVTRNGKWLFVTMNQAGKVALFDISNPEPPQLNKALDLERGRDRTTSP
jgi:hypothetical protein